MFFLDFLPTLGKKMYIIGGVLRLFQRLQSRIKTAPKSLEGFNWKPPSYSRLTDNSITSPELKLLRGVYA